MADLRDEWLKRWWTADWSWQGLASKVVAEVDCAPRTLQERWRTLNGAPTSDEELELDGQLVRDPEGRLWHIAHIPPVWPDRTATWKVNPVDERWHALAALIQHRISEGASTNGSPKGTDAQGGTTRYRWLPSGAERRAVLDGCVLSGSCIPRSSEDWMHVKATGAAFLTGVVCQDARLGAGFTLEDCLFDDALELSSCTSETAVILAGNLIYGKFSLHRTTFERAIYCAFVTALGEADCTNIQARHEADFGNGDWRGPISFRHGRYTQTSTFNASEFGSTADFSDIVFLDRFTFDKNTIRGRLTFASTSINGVSTFRNLKFDLKKPWLWHSAFDRTTFGGSVDFRGIDPACIAAYDGARIQSGARFDDLLERSSSELFDRAVGYARAAANQDAAKEQFTTSDGATVPSGSKADQFDLRVRQIEHGCRALKQLRTQSDQKFEALILTKMELMARRMQRDVPRAERFFSSLYRVSSDYGLSIHQPLITLAITTAFMAVTYYLILMDGQELWRLEQLLNTDRFLRSADLSLGAVFKPFAIWSKVERADLLHDLGPWTVLGTRLLATLQAVVSVALLFLTGLAIRKRFQVA